MKKTFKFLEILATIAVIFALSLTSCKKDDKEKTIKVTGIKVTGIKLTEEAIKIVVGATKSLEYEITPWDATNKEVTWVSDNEKVLTVDKNGTITGVLEGTANITVKTNDGGYSSTCVVTVRTDTGSGYGSTSVPKTLTLSNYYQWDAIDPINGPNPNYNTTGVASNSCKDVPTFEEMKVYLGNVIYWDNGDAGANQQSYTVEGTTYNKGLWVKKWKHCDKSLSEEIVFIDHYNPKGRPDASVIDKYLFLPACGAYDSGRLRYAGDIGYYWLSTSDPNSARSSYYLFFGNSVAHVKTLPCYYGFVPMPRL